MEGLVMVTGSRVVIREDQISNASEEKVRYAQLNV
jgi:hypothetical protein